MNYKSIILLSFGILLLGMLSCNKSDPVIFVGRYIGTLSWTHFVDTAGDFERTDTFTATIISSNNYIEFSDGADSLSGKANGNNANVSESTFSGNITGTANLSGTTLTISGTTPTQLGNINFKFVGTKQ